MKKLLWRTWLGISAVVCCMICVFTLSMTPVMAGETGNEISGVNASGGNSGANAFDGITGVPDEGHDTFGGMTNVAKQVGNSAINLFTVGGAILVVIGIILCGMCLIFFKGDTEVSKNKKHLLVIIGAAMLIFGAIGIGKGVANIGSSVGDSFDGTIGMMNEVDTKITEVALNLDQMNG